MKITRVVGLIAAAALTLPLAACGTGSGDNNAGGDNGGDSGTVSWWTWDEKQAAAYKECLPGFEAKYPDIKVNISQYAVDDYFTKLTAGFVGGNAPDAFQNSVQYLDSYAQQGQLEPLDSYISKSKFDVNVFNVGKDNFTWTDGKNYGLPLDWAGSAIYYNKDLVKSAGLTDADIQSMSWNPTDGGTFDKIVAHLTIDKKGKRGDQPGFDKKNVKTYGIGQMTSNDFLGQTTWYQFAAAAGWKMRSPQDAWPTKFNYDDPTFIKVQDYLLSLSDRGFAPKFGQFTTGDTDQLGSGSTAMASGGSWSAVTFSQLPSIHVGIAPVVAGADGKTRVVMSNSNGNMMWAGSKHKQAAWDWMSYMATPECQTKAVEQSGSFFPSIPSAMDAAVKSLATKGVDLTVFENYAKNGDLEPSLPYANGSALGTELQPLFEAFSTHQKGDEVWKEATAKAGQLLTGQGQ